MTILQENKSRSEEENQRAGKVLNGIFAAIKEGKLYTEGWRNAIAVDLGAACMVLGIDDPYKQFMYDLPWKEMCADDEENTPWDRIDTVMCYQYRWHDKEFDKMIDEEEWVRWSDNTETQYVKVI